MSEEIELIRAQSFSNSIYSIERQSTTEQGGKGGIKHFMSSVYPVHGTSFPAEYTNDSRTLWGTSAPHRALRYALARLAGEPSDDPPVLEEEEAESDSETLASSGRGAPPGRQCLHTAVTSHASGSLSPWSSKVL